MLNIFLSVAVLTSVTIVKSTAAGCSHYGEIEQSFGHDGALQICLPDSSQPNELEWTKICADGWTLTHARLACRQLDMDYRGATNTSVSAGPDTQCVSLPGCRGTETNLTECGDGDIITAGNSTILARVECRCFQGDIQLQTVTGSAEKTVQFCHQGEWRSICRNYNWQQVEANTACNQLGHSKYGATPGFECLPADNNGYLTNTRCDGSQAILSECQYSFANGCNQKNGCEDEKRHSTIQCKPANCSKGEIRLVGGSTNREGRVEVCVDGRWGTVCNNNADLAGAVCSRMGFPAKGTVANMSPFGRGPMIMYSCVLSGNENLTCAQTVDFNCDQNMGLEVMCRSYQEIVELELNRTINTTKQQCADTQTSSSVVSTRTVNVQSCDNTSTPVLGGVVGVLVTVLVVLVIGWSLSCVALVKRNSHAQKQTHSPQDIFTHKNESYSLIRLNETTQPSYSSQDPNYDFIATSHDTNFDQNQQNEKTPQTGSTDPTPVRDDFNDVEEHTNSTVSMTERMIETERREELLQYNTTTTGEGPWGE